MLVYSIKNDAIHNEAVTAPICVNVIKMFFCFDSNILNFGKISLVYKRNKDATGTTPQTTIGIKNKKPVNFALEMTIVNTAIIPKVINKIHGHITKM